MGRETTDVECAVCGSTYSSAGMHTHLRHAHGLSVDGYVDRHGEYRKKHLRRLEREEQSDISCGVCGEELQSETALAFHVKEHGYDGKEEYVVDVLRGGKRPTCACGCGQETSFTHSPPYFSEYVTGHNARGESNPMYGGQHTDEARRRQREAKLPNILNRTPHTLLSEWTGCSDTHRWRCADCGEVFEDHTNDGGVPRCSTCTQGRSDAEARVAAVFDDTDLKVARNTRSVIDGLELDVWLPEVNVAIEYNGLYWHSEVAGSTPRMYHLNKTRECENQGIKLIHLFSDEWINTERIVRSRLLHIAGHAERTVGAREHEVRSVPKDEERAFFEATHTQGFTGSSTCLGLYSDGVLQSAMSFRSARFGNEDIELVRYSSLPGLHITGGASRLFTNAVRQNGWNEVVSFGDRRWTSTTGNVYESIGFDLMRITQPSYWYMSSLYRRRRHRMQFQKGVLSDRLDDFSAERSEWENMRRNGWDRIWDCGNLKYRWTA